MEVFLSPLIVEVGLRDSVLFRPGEKRYLSLGQKRNATQIGPLMELLGKWIWVFRLPFGTILG